MDDWVDWHLEWVKQVTEIFLQKKRMSFEQFRLQWLHGSFPLNTPGIMILARAYKIHVAVFFNNNFWTTDSCRGLERCTVFLLYRGSLVFDDSRRMTSEEFTEHKAWFKKLLKYYDKVHEENDLRKLHECAQRENRTPKNYVPSDEESEEITELATFDKDTESEEEGESSSGSSGVEEADRNEKQNDIVKDIMPTTEEESGFGVDSSDESDDEKHVCSAGMAFKCSECAKIRRFQGTLNCNQCSKFSKNSKSEHIMPEIKTSSSSDDLDLERILNETVDYTKKQDVEQDMDEAQSVVGNDRTDNIEQNKKTEDKSENNAAVQEHATMDENVNKDIDDNQPNKENLLKEAKTRGFIVRPCSIILEKLDIGKPKAITDQEQNKTNVTDDENEVEFVQEQPAKKTTSKKRTISDIGKVLRNIMANSDDRYVCPQKKCTHDYGTKRALHRHLLNNHSGNNRFHCLDKNDDGTDCLQSYSSKQLLDQNTREVHGEGFIAYCGKSYTWSWQRNDHQKDCKHCHTCFK